MGTKARGSALFDEAVRDSFNSYPLSNDIGSFGDNQIVFEDAGMYIEDNKIHFRKYPFIYIEEASIVERGGVRGVLLNPSSVVYFTLSEGWKDQAVRFSLMVSQEFSNDFTQSFTLTLTCLTGSSVNVVVPNHYFFHKALPFIFTEGYSLQVDSNDFTIAMNAGSSVKTALLFGLRWGNPDDYNRAVFRGNEFFVKALGKITTPELDTTLPTDVTTNGRKTAYRVNSSTRQYERVDGPDVTTETWGLSVSHPNEQPSKTYSIFRMLREFVDTGDSSHIIGYSKDGRAFVNIQGEPGWHGGATEIRDEKWVFYTNPIGLRGVRFGHLVDTDDNRVRIGFFGTGLDVLYSVNKPSAAVTEPQMIIRSIDKDNTATTKATYTLTGGGWENDVKILSLVSGLPYGFHVIEIELVEGTALTCEIAFYDFVVYEPASPNINLDTSIKVFESTLIPHIPVDSPHFNVISAIEMQIEGSNWTKEISSFFGYTGTNFLKNTNDNATDNLVLPFSGWRVEIYGNKNVGYGTLGVYVDGVLQGTLNTANASAQYDILLGGFEGFTGQSFHTLELRATGDAADIEITRVVFYPEYWADMSSRNLNNWRKIYTYSVADSMVTGVSAQLNYLEEDVKRKSYEVTDLEEAGQLEIGKTFFPVIAYKQGSTAYNWSQWVPFRTKKDVVPDIEVTYHAGGPEPIEVLSITQEGFVLLYDASQLTGSPGMFWLNFWVTYVARS